MVRFEWASPLLGVIETCWLAATAILQPELVASAHAVVLAVCALVHSVCAVVRVSVGDVEAEALLTPLLLLHQPRVSVITGQSVLLFQAAERQPAVNWLEDNGPYHLGDGFSVADVVSYKRRDAVKTFSFQSVLDSGVGFVQHHHLLVDFKVLSSISPLGSQNITSWTGQRITDQEISIPLHQVFCNLSGYRSVVPCVASGFLAVHLQFFLQLSAELL